MLDHNWGDRHFNMEFQIPNNLLSSDRDSLQHCLLHGQENGKCKKHGQYGAPVCNAPNSSC